VDKALRAWLDPAPPDRFAGVTMTAAPSEPVCSTTPAKQSLSLKQSLAENRKSDYVISHDPLRLLRRPDRSLPFRAAHAGEARAKFLPSRIQRNSLKSLDSDERIQGNPRKSNPPRRGLSRENGGYSRKSKSDRLARGSRLSVAHHALPAATRRPQGRPSFDQNPGVAMTAAAPRSDLMLSRA